MLKFNTTRFLATSVLGAAILVTPVTGTAQMADNERWNQGQAELQKNLQPGMAADQYRQKLEQLGYKVTATNYNNPDYLEYEIVKGDQTWEVQIDVNEDTRQATDIEIAQNVWKTDATEAALDRAEQMAQTDTTASRTAARTGAAAAGAGAAAGTAARATTEETREEARRTMAMRNNQYSDRDRMGTDQMIRELEALPVGRDKQFYKDTLQQRGYDITKVNTDDTDELHLEAVKDGYSVQMEVAFDENTGRSTEVDADTLWAESEATTRTREAQERGSRTQQPSTSMSERGTERRSQADLND